MRKLVMMLVLMSGIAMSNPVPGLAADFERLGWWVVPCEDVLAIPDLQATRDGEADGLGACLRNHDVDVELVKRTVETAVPDVEWEDLFIFLHVGTTTMSDKQFQALLIPISGALILSFQ